MPDIHESIEQLKREVERKYRAQLASIEQLERELLGTISTNGSCANQPASSADQPVQDAEERQSPSVWRFGRRPGPTIVKEKGCSWNVRRQISGNADGLDRATLVGILKPHFEAKKIDVSLYSMKKAGKLNQDESGVYTAVAPEEE